MAVILEFSVFIHQLEKTDKKFHSLFYTNQMSASPSATLPSGVDNEVEVGGLFTAIRARHTVSCVIPGEKGLNSAAIHSLLATPKSQPILDITIEFMRRLNRKEIKVEAVPSTSPLLPPVFKTREENLRCEQSIATLKLSQVQLVGFRATDGGTYTADFKASGGTETAYEPEADCTNWY
jgi:hypothetical protein